jgi:hypothetical protein
LERLETRFTPTSPEVIEVLIISSTTGLIVDRILSTVSALQRRCGPHLSAALLMKRRLRHADLV